MGGSGKWIKTLIGLKRPDKDNDEKVGGSMGSRKWKLWRSSSSDLESVWRGSRSSHRLAAEASDTSSVADAFSAAVAAVVRAPPKDFRAVRQEWAAIRIQTAFRGFLARRASRALKGIVRLQALFRGWQVRKQAAVTLRCMQSLVCVQARVRARHVRMSIEGQAVQEMLKTRHNKFDPLKEAEEGWCDSQGTLEAIREKLQIRREGAMKRDRAISYSLSQQQGRSNSRSDSSPSSHRNHEIDKNSWGWSWLERCMAAKPWENRLMEQEARAEISEAQPSQNCEDSFGIHSKSPEPASVKMKKNNVTTRISARPPPGFGTNCIGVCSGSSPSLDFQYDESSASSSSISASTMVTGTTILASERTVDSNNSRLPNYMNETQSIKAKRRTCISYRYVGQRQSSGEYQFHKKAPFCNGDSQICAGSDPSLTFSKQLHLMT